ncbi:response regulator [Siccirubricoccus deserti]|nr:response regulator [Siccirubricoccus deserti]
MHLMLVEYDPLVGETLVDALQPTGFDVKVVRCAEAALEIAVTHVYSPAVLITDIDLGGGLNGLQLATILRRHWPVVRVIYITGRWSSMAGRRLGSDERCLLKPFDAERLVGTVREMVSSQATLTATSPLPTASAAPAAESRHLSFTLPVRCINAKSPKAPVVMSEEGEIYGYQELGSARRESLIRRHAELEERCGRCTPGPVPMRPKRAESSWTNFGSRTRCTALLQPCSNKPESATHSTISPARWSCCATSMAKSPCTR